MQELRESHAFENTSHRLDNGKFIVAGQFSKADLRNENGRVYKRSMWENVLKRPQIIDALKKRKMLGELGHPDKIETTPLNVSHIVTDLELKPDGEVYGEAEILDTPSGRVLKTLYEAGVTMGISSRGFLPEGSNLYAEGEDLVVPDDYELITFDFVIDPSSQGACPTVQESVKKELTTILTESRDKINSDMVQYIEGLNVIQEDKETSGKVVSESVYKNNSKMDSINNSGRKEAKTSMKLREMERYTDRLEGVVGELRSRYLTAESVINDFVKERNKADKMLKGVTDRYLTAEQAVEGLRDYSLKLEETVDEVVSLYRNSERVITDLRDRCNLSEQVIKELRDRYTLSESVIKELAKSYKVAESIVNALRDRYTLSESVIKEFAGRYTIAEAALKEMVRRNDLSESVIVGLRDRLAAARKANISLKKQLGKPVDNINDAGAEMNEDFNKLQEKCRLQDDVIQSLSEQVKAQKVEETKKVPVPNSYFEDCAHKYGISISECKRVFQAMGCRKSAFEFHMNEMRRVSRNNYSEFPYMVDGSTASRAMVESAKHREVDQIARLVESAF